MTKQGDLFSRKSVDYGKLKKPARDRLLDLMSDLVWHSREEVQRVGGVRYGARLLELRRLGYVFEDREQGKRGTGLDYRLVSLQVGEPQGKMVKVYLTENEASLISTLVHFGTIDGPFMTAQSRIADALAIFRANKEKL